MPTLKEALENAIYLKESFIYLHKFDGKIYLECIKPNQIFDLVQKYDKIFSCRIIECDEEKHVELHRFIKLENGKSYITLKAYRIDERNKEYEISIDEYNRIEGTELLPTYILPYEVIINIDCGEEFFKDSKKLLNEEMNILNTIADEVEKEIERFVKILSRKDIIQKSLDNFGNIFVILSGRHQTMFPDCLTDDLSDRKSWSKR